MIVDVKSNSQYILITKDQHHSYTGEKLETANIILHPLIDEIVDWYMKKKQEEELISKHETLKTAKEHLDMLLEMHK